MSSVTVRAEGGEPLEVTEIELARGTRELERSLGELRRASPGMRVMEHFDLVPVALVEVSVQGHATPVYVDPLGLLDRLGMKRGLPDWMHEQAAGNDWLEG